MSYLYFFPGLFEEDRSVASSSPSEIVPFDRSRFAQFLAFLKTLDRLEPRETKIIWLCLLSFGLPNLNPGHSAGSTAKDGLHLLVQATDIDYVTHGNGPLSLDLIARIEAVTHPGRNFISNLFGGNQDKPHSGTEV